MSRLVIFLWLWKGWRPVYDRRDINAVATMLRERGDLPEKSRIILLTDQPRDWYAKRTEALGVEEFPLWPDPVPQMAAGRPNCYRRLRIFDGPQLQSMGVAPDDICMSMDADSIVERSVRPLLACLHARTHNFAAMEGVASRIHGSCFAFRAFSHQHLWHTFNPKISPLQILRPWPGRARPIGSDQAWMTRHVTGEYLWRREDGCYSWNRHGALYSPRYTDNAIYWSFAGHHKPHAEIVRQVRPDLHDMWRDAYERS